MSWFDFGWSLGVEHVGGQSLAGGALSVRASSVMPIAEGALALIAALGWRRDGGLVFGELFSFIFLLQ